MKGFMLSMVFCLCTMGYLFAQQAMPVRWTFAAEKLDQTNYELILTADVEDGWYLYSQEIEEGGPVPTSISFDASTPVEITERATEVGRKKEGYDDLFGINVIKYSDKVKFIQKIKVKKGVKTVKGFVEFMTCDDAQCLPPSEMPFTITLK